jgi:ABC-type protease/lipase transport system fused ATPase/permease subunit
MPNGYETEIGGASGYRLSGGQQQRIALARALYGEPALLVLDEPNSNLDQAGEQALVESLISVRKRGGTVVVITHRSNILKVATKVLVLANGRVAAFGPPDKVLNSGGVRVVSGGR